MSPPKNDDKSEITFMCFKKAKKQRTSAAKNTKNISGQNHPELKLNLKNHQNKES